MSKEIKKNKKIPTIKYTTDCISTKTHGYHHHPDLTTNNYFLLVNDNTSLKFESDHASEVAESVNVSQNPC